MTEMLHWYAETSGGVQTGNCTVCLLYTSDAADD